MLRVEGHQFSRNTGQTFGLTCNSVSVTVQNFQEAVVNLVSDTDFKLHNEKGMSSVERKNMSRLDEEKEKVLDILVKVSLIGFKRLEKQYPEHINIHLLEK